MMYMFNFVAGLAIIYATVLLAVSFFVLFALRKVETQGLKTFGYVVAVLLWVAALFAFSTGIYTILRGRQTMPMRRTMQRGPMPQPKMPGSPMQPPQVRP